MFKFFWSCFKRKRPLGILKSKFYDGRNPNAARIPLTVTKCEKCQLFLKYMFGFHNFEPILNQERTSKNTVLIKCRNCNKLAAHTPMKREQCGITLISNIEPSHTANWIKELNKQRCEVNGETMATGIKINNNMVQTPPIVFVTSNASNKLNKCPDNTIKHRTLKDIKMNKDPAIKENVTSDMFTCENLDKEHNPITFNESFSDSLKTKNKDYRKSDEVNINQKPINNNSINEDIENFTTSINILQTSTEASSSPECNTGTINKGYINNNIKPTETIIDKNFKQQDSVNKEASLFDISSIEPETYLKNKSSKNIEIALQILTKSDRGKNNISDTLSKNKTTTECSSSKLSKLSSIEKDPVISNKNNKKSLSYEDMIMESIYDKLNLVLARNSNHKTTSSVEVGQENHAKCNQKTKGTDACAITPIKLIVEELCQKKSDVSNKKNKPKDINYLRKSKHKTVASSFEVGQENHAKCNQKTNEIDARAITPIKLMVGELCQKKSDVTNEKIKPEDIRYLRKSKHKTVASSIEVGQEHLAKCNQKMKETDARAITPIKLTIHEPCQKKSDVSNEKNKPDDIKYLNFSSSSLELDLILKYKQIEAYMNKLFFGNDLSTNYEVERLNCDNNTTQLLEVSQKNYDALDNLLVMLTSKPHSKNAKVGLNINNVSIRSEKDSRLLRATQKLKSLKHIRMYNNKSENKRQYKDSGQGGNKKNYERSNSEDTRKSKELDIPKMIEVGSAADTNFLIEEKRYKGVKQKSDNNETLFKKIHEIARRNNLFYPQENKILKNILAKLSLTSDNWHFSSARREEELAKRAFNRSNELSKTYLPVNRSEEKVVANNNTEDTNKSKSGELLAQSHENIAQLQPQEAQYVTEQKSPESSEANKLNNTEDINKSKSGEILAQFQENVAQLQPQEAQNVTESKSRELSEYLEPNNLSNVNLIKTESELNAEIVSNKSVSKDKNVQPDAKLNSTGLNENMERSAEAYELSKVPIKNNHESKSVQDNVDKQLDQSYNQAVTTDGMVESIESNEKLVQTTSNESPQIERLLKIDIEPKLIEPSDKKLQARIEPKSSNLNQETIQPYNEPKSTEQNKVIVQTENKLNATVKIVDILQSDTEPKLTLLSEDKSQIDVTLNSPKIEIADSSLHATDLNTHLKTNLNTDPSKAIGEPKVTETKVENTSETDSNSATQFVGRGPVTVSYKPETDTKITPDSSQVKDQAFANHKQVRPKSTNSSSIRKHAVRPVILKVPDQIFEQTSVKSRISGRFSTYTSPLLKNKIKRSASKVDNISPAKSRPVVVKSNNAICSRQIGKLKKIKSKKLLDDIKRSVIMGNLHSNIIYKNISAQVQSQKVMQKDSMIRNEHKKKMVKNITPELAEENNFSAFIVVDDTDSQNVNNTKKLTASKKCETQKGIPVQQINKIKSKSTHRKSAFGVTDPNEIMLNYELSVCHAVDKIIKLEKIVSNTNLPNLHDSDLMTVAQKYGLLPKMNVDSDISNRIEIETSNTSMSKPYLHVIENLPHLTDLMDIEIANPNLSNNIKDSTLKESEDPAQILVETLLKSLAKKQVENLKHLVSLLTSDKNIKSNRKLGKNKSSNKTKKEENIDKGAEKIVDSFLETSAEKQTVENLSQQSAMMKAADPFIERLAKKQVQNLPYSEEFIKNHFSNLSNDSNNIASRSSNTSLENSILNAKKLNAVSTAMQVETESNLNLNPKEVIEKIPANKNLNERKFKSKKYDLENKNTLYESQLDIQQFYQMILEKINNLKYIDDKHQREKTEKLFLSTGKSQIKQIPALTEKLVTKPVLLEEQEKTTLRKVNSDHEIIINTPESKVKPVEGSNSETAITRHFLNIYPIENELIRLSSGSKTIEILIENIVQVPTNKNPNKLNNQNSETREPSHDLTCAKFAKPNMNSMIAEHKVEEIFSKEYELSENSTGSFNVALSKHIINSIATKLTDVLNRKNSSVQSESTDIPEEGFVPLRQILHHTDFKDENEKKLTNQKLPGINKNVHESGKLREKSYVEPRYLSILRYKEPVKNKSKYKKHRKSCSRKFNIHSKAEIKEPIMINFTEINRHIDEIFRRLSQKKRFTTKTVKQLYFELVNEINKDEAKLHDSDLSTKTHNHNERPRKIKNNSRSRKEKKKLHVNKERFLGEKLITSVSPDRKIRSSSEIVNDIVQNIPKINLVPYVEAETSKIEVETPISQIVNREPSLEISPTTTQKLEKKNNDSYHTPHMSVKNKQESRNKVTQGGSESPISQTSWKEIFKPSSKKTIHDYSYDETSNAGRKFVDKTYFSTCYNEKGVDNKHIEKISSQNNRANISNTVYDPNYPIKLIEQNGIIEGSLKSQKIDSHTKTTQQETISTKSHDISNVSEIPPKKVINTKTKIQNMNENVVGVEQEQFKAKEVDSAKSQDSGDSSLSHVLPAHVPKSVEAQKIESSNIKDIKSDKSQKDDSSHTKTITTENANEAFLVVTPKEGKNTVLKIDKINLDHSKPRETLKKNNLLPRRLNHVLPKYSIQKKTMNNQETEQQNVSIEITKLAPQQVDIFSKKATDANDIVNTNETARSLHLAEHKRILDEAVTFHPKMRSSSSTNTRLKILRKSRQNFFDKTNLIQDTVDAFTNEHPKSQKQNNLLQLRQTKLAREKRINGPIRIKINSTRIYKTAPFKVKKTIFTNSRETFDTKRITSKYKLETKTLLAREQNTMLGRAQKTKSILKTKVDINDNTATDKAIKQETGGLRSNLLPSNIQKSILANELKVILSERETTMKSTSKESILPKKHNIKPSSPQETIAVTSTEAQEILGAMFEETVPQRVPENEEIVLLKKQQRSNDTNEITSGWPENEQRKSSFPKQKESDIMTKAPSIGDLYSEAKKPKSPQIHTVAFKQTTILESPETERMKLRKRVTSKSSKANDDQENAKRIKIAKDTSDAPIAAVNNIQNKLSGWHDIKESINELLKENSSFQTKSQIKQFVQKITTETKKDQKILPRNLLRGENPAKSMNKSIDEKQVPIPMQNIITKECIINTSANTSANNSINEKKETVPIQNNKSNASKNIVSAGSLEILQNEQQEETNKQSLEKLEDKESSKSYNKSIDDKVTLTTLLKEARRQSKSNSLKSLKQEQNVDLQDDTKEETVAKIDDSVIKPNVETPRQLNKIRLPTPGTIRQNLIVANKLQKDTDNTPDKNIGVRKGERGGAPTPPNRW